MLFSIFSSIKPSDRFYRVREVCNYHNLDWFEIENKINTDAILSKIDKIYQISFAREVSSHISYISGQSYDMGRNIIFFRTSNIANLVTFIYSLYRIRFCIFLSIFRDFQMLISDVNFTEASFGNSCIIGYLKQFITIIY